jgi:hypothetical protein
MRILIALLLVAMVGQGCIFHGYIEPITIYDKPTETPVGTPAATEVATEAPTPEPTATATPPAPDSPLATPSPEPTPILTANSQITLTIAGNLDDAHQWHNGIELSAWPAWLGYWDRAPEHAAWRFVGLPVAAVDGATLRLRGTHGAGLNMDVRVHAVAVDDAAPWIAGSDLLTLPLTTAFAPLADIKVDQWNEIDVTAPLAEVLARPGWSPGNAVAFVAVSLPQGRNVAGGVVDFALNPAMAAQLVVLPPAAPVAAAVSRETPTFGLAELEAAAAEAGIVLRPGTYSCDLVGDDYARCMVNADGVPGGAICVTADGWGACQ